MSFHGGGPAIRHTKGIEMQVVAESTVELIDGMTRPLASAGALPQSERKSLLEILRGHTPKMQGQKLDTGKKRGYTVADTCEILGLSRSTVQRMLRNCELRGNYLRPGSPKTLRIDPASVEAVLSGKEGVR
jgi:hypothetical protein